ncbi:molybdate ABC transporter permease subunit [Bacillaceae bacterium Marseille-Q3522]|nr:molybdate ABC transporter permease subunit [Bacillaceae bacterium Marseille-Q3522]
MINSYEFWQPLLLSLKVAAAALVIVMILGTGIAWIMRNAAFRGKTLLETVFLIPIVLPPTVIGFMLIYLFGRNGLFGKIMELLFQHSLLFTWWAAVIAAVTVSFPLMYQAAKTGFEAVDKEIEDAAKVDGANGWKVFFYITLPLSLRAILAGIIVSFARALGEFGATLMFAGNIPGKTQTVPTAIYVAMESGQMSLAWAWVGIMILLSFLMIWLTSLFK